jgi:cell filamentation protein
MRGIPMSKYSNSDHYLDTNTGILKNRLGITTEAELEKAEAAFASVRSYELARNPLKGGFDLKHLKAIHHYMFKDLYEWAGRTRSIDISKGQSFFAHHPHIEASAKLLFDKLAQEKHLAGLSKNDFSERAATYLGEINALHPFREGNGRTQREFISHLAYTNDYYIEWQHISQTDIIQASIESFNGNYAKFASLLQSNIRDLKGGSTGPATTIKKKIKFPKP